MSILGMRDSVDPREQPIQTRYSRLLWHCSLSALQRERPLLQIARGHRTIAYRCVRTPTRLMKDSPSRSGSLGPLPYVVAATFFMEYLATTIIATALPEMARSFGTSPNALSLGMSAYMIALAIFISAS